jgi:hypothetical protein
VSELRKHADCAPGQCLAGDTSPCAIFRQGCVRKPGCRGDGGDHFPDCPETWTLGYYRGRDDEDDYDNEEETTVQQDMNVNMTVNRLELIAKLEEARAREMAAAGGEREQERLAEARETLADYRARWAKAWKQRIKLVEAGELRLVHNGGGGMTVSRDAPALPTLTEKQYRAVTEIERLQELEQEAAEAARPYDAALELLRMSADETVGVSGADYQRLLAGSGERKRRGPLTMKAR